MDSNEETLAFYHQIGVAITQWAHVEAALLHILATCFDDDNFRLHATSFFAVDNFRSKLQMADSLVATKYARTKHFAEWRELADACSTRAVSRNKIAHYWMLTDLSQKPGRRCMLLPRRIKISKKQKARPQKYTGALCVRDIAGYSKEFSYLSLQLENFSDRLAGREGRFGDFIEKPKNPPTIRELRRQLYSYASNPPRSSRK